MSWVRVPLVTQQQRGISAMISLFFNGLQIRSCPLVRIAKERGRLLCPKNGQSKAKCFHIVYPLNYAEKHSANNSSEKAERPHTYGYTRKHVPVNVRPLNHIATSPAKAEFLSLPPKGGLYLLLFASGFPEVLFPFLLGLLSLIFSIGSLILGILSLHLLDFLLQTVGRT